jgi:hypothetical protein
MDRRAVLANKVSLAVNLAKCLATFAAREARMMISLDFDITFVAFVIYWKSHDRPTQVLRQQRSMT